MIKYILILLVYSCVFTMSAECAPTDTIVQHGITWTLANPVEHGQFVNGDYWVIDDGITPVVVTGISPGYSIETDPAYLKAPREINGSSINRVGWPQGFDSYQDYGSEYNVGIGIASGTPLVLHAGESLISTISNPAPVVKPDSNSYVQVAAVLTVLDTVPPSDAFRPSYNRLDTVLHTYSDLNLSVLKNITYNNKPDAEDLITKTRYPFLDVNTGNFRYVHPEIFAGGNYYYPDVAIAPLALMVHLDYTETIKKDVLINLIQLGIDFYGILLKSPIGWTPDGTRKNGKKLPILYAAIMLNDAGMLDVLSRSGDYYLSGGYNRDTLPSDHISFGEDATFYVDQYMIDLTNTEGWEGALNLGYLPYTQDMLGMPEWGIFTYWQFWKCSASWTTTYRLIDSGGGGYFTGAALAALMIDGGKDTWRNNSFFDYVERLMSITSDGSDPFEYFVPNQVAGNRPDGLIGTAYDLLWTTYNKNTAPGAKRYRGYRLINAVD